MKNTLGGKVARGKSAKDASAIEFNKPNGSKRNVFNACVGRPFDEVNCHDFLPNGILSTSEGDYLLIT